MANAAVSLSLTVGGAGGEEKSKSTLTEEKTIKKLVKLAGAVRQPKSTKLVSWKEDVRVITVKLPEPVGLFTTGEIEVWSTSLRVPGIDSYRFYGRGESQADALATFVIKLITT